MKDSEQAQHALDFLSHCLDIENGGFSSEFKGRALNATEAQVKEKALRALSIYYGTIPTREETKKTKRPRRKKTANINRTP